MKYRVHRIDEEFCCDWCGCPTFQGESAWEDEQGRHFCNQSCSTSLHNREIILGLADEIRRNIRQHGHA